MGKLPYGVPNKHVQKSQGGDSNLMKFYCTQNQTTYGRKFSKFQPRQGKHTGTGYLSNFRPGVYYSAQLDHLDNPVMGAIVADNYESVTHKGFKPYNTPSGNEPLPHSLKQVGTGFVREKPLTIPTQDDVSRVNIDTRIVSAPADIRPRHKATLHTLNGKDPVEAENGGYGPGYMTTETHERFNGAQPDRTNLARLSLGNKEGSGFVHSQNVEPITFHPDHAHAGDMPSWLTDRPTGISVMKTSFRPSKFPQGDETFPKLANRSDRNTGFTTSTKAKPGFVHRVLGDAYDKAGDIPPAALEKIRKNNPAEYINATNPDNYSSIEKNIYKGQQRPSQNEADRLARTKVGSKEPSGYVENNDRFIQTADNPARFITHYMTRFQDKTPKGLDREGNTWGGVQPQKADGFTKSTRVHDLGVEGDATATLRRLEPYVSRSIQARDPFFDDHTYDSKIGTLQRSKTVPVF